MKKARILNVFSLLLNLALVGLVCYVLFGMFGNSLTTQLARLDVLAGLLLALFALICIPFNLAGIAKGQKLGKFAYILKLIGTSTSVTILLFALIYLAMNNSWDIAAQLGNFSFTEPAFYLVFIIPLLSLVAFLFFDQSEKTIFLVNFFSIIPALLYFVFYAINHASKLVAIDSGYDWYNLFGTNDDDLVRAIIVIGAVVLSAFIISFILWAINRCLNKAYFKEIAQEQSEEKEQPAEQKEEKVEETVQKPVAEEKVEEPQEEPVEENVDPVAVQDEYVEEDQEEKEMAAPQVEEKKPVEKKAPTKKPVEKKEVAKKETAKKATQKKEEEKDNSSNTGTKVYHLTKRKEDGMWAITFVGGQKAVKLFKTKKEAEAALEVLTKNQGATALIRNSKGAKAGKFASSIKSEKED